MRRVLFAAGAAIALAAGLLAPSIATAGPTGGTGPYAPLDRPGPPLDVPAAQLAASLSCHGNLAAGEPVLLVPGTTTDPTTDFSWNYEKGFTAQGRPWCAVTLPNHAMSDIQTAGEYVTSAIRTMHVRSGHKVDILGWSQGGMVPRWSLRFWPDTRADVDDVVALDPSNHGTLDADAVCALTCAPAFWQQQTGSHFMAALNSGAETFAGVSYTQIWSATDEVVVPNVGPDALSSLHTGAGAISNVEVQSICPTDVDEHLAMGTFDPVGYALAQDALSHSGPAFPARIPSSVCSEVVSPPVDPLTAPADFAKVGLEAADQVATYPHTATEPALASYVYG